jgi:hypothetical protein
MKAAINNTPAIHKTTATRSILSITLPSAKSDPCYFSEINQILRHHKENEPPAAYNGNEEGERPILLGTAEDHASRL